MKSWQRNLYILMFVQFVSSIGFSSVFPFLPLYAEELGSTTGLSIEYLTGLVFSAQAFTMMIAAPIWGALADRHGRKMMVMRASLGGSVTIFMMAFVQSAEQLVLLRALQGALTGVVAALTALVAASVPREHAGYALGLLQVGNWGGVSIGPLIGGFVADMFGFSASFIVTAALLTSAGIMVSFGVEEHFEPLPRSATTRHDSFIQAWGHVLKSQGVAMTYLTRFLSNFGRTVVMSFSALFIADLLHSSGQTATITGLALALSAVAGTVGAIYMGRMGDRIGHRRVLIGVALLAALFYLPMSLSSNIWQFALLLTLAGAAAGGIMPTLSALLASYTEPGEEGAVYGLESSIMAGARAVAPMLGAVLVTWLGLRSIFIASSIAFAVMAVIAWRWLPRSSLHTPLARSTPTDSKA